MGFRLFVVLRLSMGGRFLVFCIELIVEMKLWVLCRVELVVVLGIV